MTTRGKVAITLLLLAMVGFGCWKWWGRLGPAPGLASAPNPSSPLVSEAPPAAPKPAIPVEAASAASLPAAPSEPVEIGVAYGTEKRRWLEWAVEEFGKMPTGRTIKINLIPLGSIEAAQAIVGGDTRIHVWSPASSLYTANFVPEFELKHNRKPFEKEEQLALTPMVFVTWKEREELFEKKYTNLTFTTLGRAIKEKGGWNGIAQKPEWGFFKFAHTHPNQSISGLTSLLLMAYDYHDKERGLTLTDILDASFQTWLVDLESSVVDLSNSTGNLMRDMVLKGPSTYDAVLVYESVAIDYLKNAEGRWGQLRVTYPAKNLWSDHPYYILNTSWSEKKHRQAAELFLRMLMSETCQKAALTHGFRPGNPAVPILFPESPFVMYQKYGLRAELPSVCELPKAEVIHNLLVGWNNNVRKK